MKSLFIAHPQSLELAKHFGTTFILDCTYKTNKFKLPLLHIAGINNSNKSFSVAFCFISKERTNQYIWALEQLSLSLDSNHPSVLVTDKEQALINAIEEVFPQSSHILCSWHIFKNIQTHCRKNFDSEDSWSNF